VQAVAIALAFAAVAGLGLFLVIWGKARADREAGEVRQAGREAAVAAVTQARIAEAVVKAPDNKAEVIEALKKGGF
jgi:hypothetical protein